MEPTPVFVVCSIVLVEALNSQASSFHLDSWDSPPHLCWCVYSCNCPVNLEQNIQLYEDYSMTLVLSHV